ncbi:CBS domain-containing protein [Nonomuraea sediminis]|uniref:CBS domain-containing protein n=1 Tax=Nonomuraea sediminis TaxID=2835864 RepID=UPI001BDDC93E|nr:CBS domain-containing protein [Nonomuraea sediminis]
MAIEVKDVMGRVAIAVHEDASFGDIVAAMKRYAVGAVTVIDLERRPIGVVSEDDLLHKETDTVRHSVSMFESRRQRTEHVKAQAVTASELMTSPPVTVTPTTPVRDAARIMLDKRIKQLPVVEPITGQIVGTLHQTDVLRVFTRPLEELAADIRALLPKGVSFYVYDGVVTLSGRVARTSEGTALIEAVRQVEGVVDVSSELVHDSDDLLIVPPEA